MSQYQSTKVNPYLTQKIMSASKDQLISYVYDVGVVACKQEDSDKASRAVSTLVKALDFDTQETSPMANTFYNVYRHLNYLINNHKFAQAGKIFSELKLTWSSAFGVH